MNSACIAVFARAIESGKVKTRLAATLGDAAALDVYCQMLERTLQTVQATGLPACIWATDSQCPALQSLAQRYGCSLQQQQGQSLGERMLHALRAQHRYHERVVLIGSDCVLLDRATETCDPDRRDRESLRAPWLRRVIRFVQIDWTCFGRGKKRHAGASCRASSSRGLRWR